MGRLMTNAAGYGAFDDQAASVLSPARLEQFKLDRLLELRAVIDSVRREREHALLYDTRTECIRHS